MNFDESLPMIEDDLYNYFLNGESNGLSVIPETLEFDNGTESLNDFPEIPAIQTEFKYEPIITSPPPELPQPKSRTKATPKRATKKARVTVKQEVKKESHEEFFHDDKYRKRLEANKRSAQLSRERKKSLKLELEQKLDSLSQENESLGTQIIQMETENKVLKGEFIQLQKLISESPVLTKMMDRATSMALPMPQDAPPASSETKTLFSPGTFDPAAFMYLMIVLQSFNQHFGGMNSNTLQYNPTPIAV